MNKYDFVFVVLVYRNTNDLRDFFVNLSIPRSKVIVVNSFYDKASENDFKKIAEEYQASFISVPNKGYGAGNNAGVKYALDNYLFDYLVISNADIVVKQMEIECLRKYGNAIVAPKILNLKNKNQNPSSAYKSSAFIEKIKYWLFKGEHSKLIWGLYAYSRLTKILFYITQMWYPNIFSAHGAFVIFPSKIANILYPFYNEEMFLFREEEHLGRLALSKGIKTIYAPDIVISHKEDGSMSVANVNIFKRERDSYLVYYNYWKNEF